MAALQDGSVEPECNLDFTVKNKRVHFSPENSAKTDVKNLSSKHATTLNDSENMNYEQIVIKYDEEAPFNPNTEIYLNKYKKSKAERRAKLLDQLKHIYGHKR